MHTAVIRAKERREGESRPFTAGGREGGKEEKESLSGFGLSRRHCGGEREKERGVNSRRSFASQGRRAALFYFRQRQQQQQQRCVVASPACSKEIVFHPSRNEKGASERGREGERERGREGAVMSSSPLIAAVPVLVASASAVAVI